jgi:hypothetical protein
MIGESFRKVSIVGNDDTCQFQLNLGRACVGPAMSIYKVRRNSISHVIYQ